MGSAEQVVVLRQGGEAWNRWRGEHTISAPNLSRAYLHGTDLRRAFLSKADLSGADLSEADLGGADLRGAELYKTTLGNVDLSGCKGLETCWHSGPSIIDHRTLQRSGPLPLAFLRGVGLPENLIEYLP